MSAMQRKMTTYEEKLSMKSTTAPNAAATVSTYDIIKHALSAIVYNTRQYIHDTMSPADLNLRTIISSRLDWIFYAR